MLVGDGADGLEVVTILDLASLFLHQFVGNLKARELVADACRKVIAGREVAFVVDGEACRSALVGEVLRYDWVEVVAGHAA